jgi:tetratricopeptide (TPR) repeat protein
LAAELEQLHQKYPAQIGIRLLQATVATYLQEPQKAEDYLRRATAECQEPWRAELELARHYVRTGRPAEAVEVGRAACRHQRQAAEPWLLLARLHVTNGDHDAGRQAVQQGLAAVASPWEKRSLSIELALLETGRGRPAAGIEILRSLAAQNERDVHVRALLLSLPEIRKDQAVAEQLIGELRQAEGEGGMWWRWHQASLWLASGQWQVKRQELADLLEYDIAAAPEWTGPVLLLAELHEKLGDAGHAEEVCRRGLARNPGALELADRLMSLLEKQGRAAEAREVFQKMALDPRVATAWRVGSALQDGDFVRAIEELKGRVTENGRDAEARILLARLLYGQNRDPNEAAGYLEQAQQIDPNSRAVLHARLLWLVAQNRWEELKGISGAYLTARSLDSQALLEAAAMLAAVDSPEIKKESVKLFERAASLLPASADAQLGWASTLYQMGDARGAQTVYRQWLTEHPDDARALNDLAWILQEDGRRYDEALELANRAVELGPDDPHFLDTRATILGKLPRRLREAREDVARLVALEPDRSPEKARALLRLGRICVQLHDLGPARQHLEAALALDREMNVLTEAERAEIRRIMPMAGI